jgi:hypothetical protein
MKRLNKFLTLYFTTILTVATLTLIITPSIKEVKAITLADIDDAINLALDWLDRMAYIEINSTHAVATDCPSLSFRIRHPDGNWTIMGKRTNYLSLPNAPDADHVKGGAFCEATENQNLGGFYDPGGAGGGEPLDIRALLYKWDIDADEAYGDVSLYVEYATINTTWSAVYGEIFYVNPDLVGLDLYLGLDLVIDNIQTGSNFKLYREWGWPGRRYTIRPTTKGLADLYYQLATKKFEHLGGQTYAQVRGVDYLNRSKKLYRTWYQSGYIIDRFDGVYNVTLLDRPFPEIHGGIPPNPDLIEEYKYAFPYDNTPYYGTWPSWQYDWFNYSNYPVTPAGSGYVLRHPMVSRHVMPENEEWVNVPFQCNETAFIFPYKSRTGFEWARNAYIGDGFAFDLISYHDPPYIPTPGPLFITQVQGAVVLGVGADARSIRACHDMWKYGRDVPYGLETLRKEFIDPIVWDGNGVPYDTFYGVPLFRYVAYGTHCTASYAVALYLYYTLTGDSWYGNRLDEVIGVLLQVQNQPGEYIYSRSFKQKYYRAEYVGAFMPGYSLTGSYGQANIYSYQWSDIIYWFLARWHDVFKTGFYEDYQPITIPCLGNTECTIPSVWALILYRTLNRLPTLPEEPEYVLGFENVLMYTDHGGSLGGDGMVEIVGNVNSTYLGGETGNLYRHVGQGDKIRMQAWSGAGDGWSKITYYWSFDLNEDATNFKISLGVSIPDWIAVSEPGGNSLTVQVDLYDNNWQLITSDKRVPLVDLSGYTTTTGGIYLYYHNLTLLDSLSAGTYHVYMKFILHAGGLDTYALLGYTGYPEHVYMEGLPVQIDFFGFDYDPPAPPPPKFKVRLTGLPAGEYYGDIWDVFEGTIWSPDMLPTEFWRDGTLSLYPLPAVGYYFHYWQIENTRLGISRTVTSELLELELDHDYNITAFFSTSPGNATLSITTKWIFGPFLEKLPFWGRDFYLIDTFYAGATVAGTVWHRPVGTPTWIEGPGTWDYPNGTAIELNVTVNDGYSFRGWVDQYKLYSLPEDDWHEAVTEHLYFTFNLTKDTVWAAVFVPPTTVLHVLDAETGDPTGKDYDITMYGEDGATWRFSVASPPPDLFMDHPGGTESYLCQIDMDGYYPEAFEINPWVSDPYSEGVAYAYEDFEQKWIYLQPIEFTGGGGGGGGWYLRSRLITFYAEIPYSNLTSNYYVDSERLMYAEPLFNKTGKVKIVLHYNTMQPVIEIETENIGFIKVDVEEFYRVYAKENVMEKVETASFFGFRVDADTALTLELGGFEKPRELWKQVLKPNATGSSEFVKFENWQWLDGKIIASFTPGDPAVSVVWGTPLQTLQDLMLQLAVAIIAVAAVVTLMKTVKDRE